MAADHEDMQPESYSPGFHPPPDRQTDLLVLQCELMSAGWECSLYFLTSSSILFSPFSQSNDLPLTSLACVWGHWLSEDATCGHQSDGWILAVSFSWSRVFFSPPSAALHMFRQSRVLVKNECWMKSKNSICSSWLAVKNTSSSFSSLPYKVACLLRNLW